MVCVVLILNFVFYHPVDLVFIQIDEDVSLVPETFQGRTYGFNSANMPAKGFQF